MHGENSLKLAWTGEHILGVLRLALIPLSRDSRGAQDDKSEMISSKETIFAAVEIQTDRCDFSLDYVANKW